ncbi:ABC transporter permease [Candidatus Bipolaricaulota bacterium]|nr:ABC transporter permease [Candidatus Bipolaricaulota bacterium]
MSQAIIILKEKREAQLLLLNLIIAGLLAIFFPGSFPNPGNLRALGVGMVYDALVAVGMTYVLILGGLDLSVGSNVALTSVVTTLLLARWGITSVPMAIAMGLGLSATIGAINGAIITGVSLNPFIVTLGMMAIARGVARVLSAGFFITDLPASFEVLGNASVFGVPLQIILTLGIIAVFDFLVRRWSVLNRAYFVGTQPDNAETVGINVGRVIFVGFIISGLFSGIAAIFLSSHLGIGYSQFAGGMALRALAAAVVGGADFTGGKGSVWGAFLGVLLLALVSNGFVQVGLSAYWEQVVNAIVLIIAIWAASFSEK